MIEIKNFNQKIIGKIESELLSTLFYYVVPFLDKKINLRQKQQQKTSIQQQKNLENILDNIQPKIGLKDIRELEALLLKNLSDNVKAGKKIGVSSSAISYSLNLIRQKTNQEKPNDYSISIKYEENENEDKLKISIKNAEKEIYSAEIANKKEQNDKVAPYSVKISYEDNYSEERLAITYKQQLKNYLHQHIESKEDMTNRVPLKWLNILPESVMGSVLGFTYLGENFMGRRADLTGKTARMVDIHESIHTPDEYETRVLTRWIMERIKPKYVK
ncbi:hypothetical protein HYY70_04200 [Candidatus Woesearchaeota archaeon]|nr:hypothetical protein [Candidatus Woesearchaeota archaeon]